MITSAFFNFLLQALLSALCLNLTLDRMYSFSLQMKNGNNDKNQNGKNLLVCLYFDNVLLISVAVRDNGKYVLKQNNGLSRNLILQINLQNLQVWT